MNRKGQDTRSRLIETAAALMWGQSFHSTGVDEICTQARANRGSFYHFFDSKTDLAIDAVRENWAQVRRQFFDPLFESSSTGLEQLDGIIRAVDRLQRQEFEGRGVYLGCPFGNVGQEMAHQDERLQAAVDEIFQDHVRYFRRALERAAENGEIEGGNLALRAETVLALMEGALLVAKVANAPERFAAVMKALPQVVLSDPG